MKIPSIYLLVSCVCLSAALTLEVFARESVDDFDYSSCRKSANGAIKKKTNEVTIHKWVDENGNTHFGSRAPALQPSEQVNSRSTRKNYFEIEFGKESKQPRYKEELKISIRNVYKILTSMMGESKLNQVSIRLWIFDDEDNYLAFQDKLNLIGASKKRNGFHIGSKNIVAVLEKSENQAIGTSIHEATHVITRGNFGKQPRWLNEGIAEYMERILSHGQAVQVNPHQAWYRYLEAPHVPIDKLMASKFKYWEGYDSSEFYAYSWALVFFMLSNNERKQLFTDYLQKSLTQPCDSPIDSFDYFSRRYPNGASQMKSDFEEWLDLKSFSPHLY